MAAATEFHLLRFFTTASLVAFLLVAALLGYVFRTLSIDGLLKQYEREHVSHARVLANELWDKNLGALIQAAAGKSAAELQAMPQLPSLHQKIQKLLKGTTIFKLKVYDLKGMTVYSTDFHQIGENNSTDKGVIDGLRGLSSSALSHKDQFNAFEGVVQQRDLVETYVPGYDPMTGKLGGVFEIYGDATSVLADVGKRQWSMALSVIGLLAILYLTLFAIVKKAQTIIIQQNLEREKIQAELSSSEERWKFALEGAGQGVWDRNLETGEVVVSKYYRDIYGFAEDDEINLTGSWEDRVHPEDVSAVRADREAYLTGQKSVYANERRMQCKDGSWKWIQSRGMVVERNAQGHPLRMIGTHADISARKQAEEKLLLAASVFRDSHEGITITAADNTIIDVNEAFTRITGFQRDEVLGRTPRILSSGRHGQEFYAAMWRSLKEHGHWSGEIWNRRKNGEVYAELLTISAVRDAFGQTHNYVALFSDITPMKEQQQQLEHIAHYDALTNLPNRLLLADRLRQAMRQSQRSQHSLAVVFLDLDGFKEVNDQHGHDVGDTLLVNVSQRLKAALREGDTLARMGGDEFVAVLSDLERPQDCEPVLKRLLHAAAEPVCIGQSVLQVSASIGVTFYPQGGVDADMLLHQADQAMYAAKQAGKSRYVMFKAA